LQCQRRLLDRLDGIGLKPAIRWAISRAVAKTSSLATTRLTTPLASHLGRGKAARRQHDFHGMRVADLPDEADQRASRRHEAVLRLGQLKDSVCRRDPNVGRKHDLEPAADAQAADGADDGLEETGKLEMRRVPGRDVERVGGKRGNRFLEIGADAEGAIADARSGQPPEHCHRH
jgi:hypothetical protein